MQNKSIPTGYVPVTILLPANLAEKLQHKNYNWEALAELFISSADPSLLADDLLDLYFDFTRLLTLAPEHVVGNTIEQLYACQQIIRALQSMEPKVVSGESVSDSQ